MGTRVVGIGASTSSMGPSFLGKRASISLMRRSFSLIRGRINATDAPICGMGARNRGMGTPFPLIRGRVGAKDARIHGMGTPLPLTRDRINARMPPSAAWAHATAG